MFLKELLKPAEWFVIILTSVLQGSVSPIVYFFFGNLLNQFPNVSAESYGLTIGVFGGLSLFMPIGFHINGVISNRAAKRIQVIIEDELLQKKPSFIEEKAPGSVSAQILMEAENLKISIQGTIPEIIKQSVAILLLTAECFYFHWSFGVICLSLILLNILISVIVMKLQMKYVMKSIFSKMAISSLLEETFSGFKVIRSYSIEDLIMNKFKLTTRNLCKSEDKLSEVRAFPQVALSAITVAAFLITTYVGQVLISETPPESSIGAVVVAWSVIINVGQSLRVLVLKIFDISAMQRSLQSLNTTCSIGKHRDEFSGGLTSTSNWVLAADDIHFGYGAKTIIEGLSLVFRENSMTAIVGSSGCGKSTLLSLLMRFLEPKSGAIKLGDYPVTDYNIKWYYSNIGYVSQDLLIFDGDIHENITLGKEIYTLQEVEEASRLAEAHQFIGDLPEGYKTRVGPKGFKLSGGQKQRIALARAFLIKPKILILDEATSALDAKCESLIQKTIESWAQKCTIIVVAHRLSTIKKANTICVLQGGKLVEMGNYEELRNLGGYFSSLISAQESTMFADRKREDRSFTM